MSALTTAEVTDISLALNGLKALSDSCERILLGPIPVLDEDGLTTLGHLEQGDDYAWTFSPAGHPPSSHSPHPRLIDTLAPVTPIRAYEEPAGRFRNLANGGYTCGNA